MDQEEPTMDEILASIRQILSGEQEETAPIKKDAPIVIEESAAKVYEVPEQAPEQTSKETPEQEPEKEPEAPLPVADPAPDALIQHIEIMTNTDVITLTPEMLVVPEEEAQETILLNETLLEEDPADITEETEPAKQEAPQPSPAQEPEPTKEATPSSGSNQDALTALMAQLIKPALKDWMNKNMPQVLEKMLQEELKNNSSQK